MEDWSMEAFLKEVEGAEIEEIELQDVESAEKVETEQKTEENDQPSDEQAVQTDNVEETPKVEVNPFEEQIKKQQEVIDRFEKKLDSVVQATTAKEKAEADAELQRLEAEKWEAVQYGDVKGVKEVEEKIRQKSLTQPEQPANVEIKLPNCVEEFAKENSWFEKDQDMTSFMVRETEYLVRQKGVKLEDALVEAKKAVKKMYSHKFENPKRDEPAPVVTKDKSINKNKQGKTLADLDEDEISVWNVLKHKGVTQDEFLAGL